MTVAATAWPDARVSTAGQGNSRLLIRGVYWRKPPFTVRVGHVRGIGYTGGGGASAKDSVTPARICAAAAGPIRSRGAAK